MTTVTFDQFKLNDIQSPLTIEESFRDYGNWAGIHDYLFDDFYTLSDSGWTPSASANYASGVLTIDATGQASAWYPVIQDSVNLPPNYTIHYHKTDYNQAVVVSQEDGQLTYLVGTNNSGYPFVMSKSESTSFETKFLIPVSTPEVADVVIGFRQILFTDNETEVWYVISMWMNDKLFLTYIEKNDHFILNSKFGVGAYGGEVIEYSNLRIPELTEFTEWGSLDPGESSLGGLNRILEGRYIKYFVKTDGSLRAWRPKSVANSKTFFYDSDVFETTVNTDIVNIYTHIRMVGAYLWAEFVDTDLIERYGHKFKEENNPMLFTERECAEEAERTIKRYEESGLTSDIKTYGTPLLEPEDRVETDDGAWLIDSIEQSYDHGHINQNMSLRKYVWGS